MIFSLFMIFLLKTNKQTLFYSWNTLDNKYSVVSHPKYVDILIVMIKNYPNNNQKRFFWLAGSERILIYPTKKPLILCGFKWLTACSVSAQFVLNMFKLIIYHTFCDLVPYIGWPSLELQEELVQKQIWEQNLALYIWNSVMIVTLLLMLLFIKD